MSATEFVSRLTARSETTGIIISEAHAARLSVYADLLERWNQRINLTGLPLSGWPDQTIDRLFLEPIGAVPLVTGLSGTWVDLGSGGGSPAIPLAVMIEGFQLTLTESRGKKAAFLREAIRALELKDAEVEGRFEALLSRKPSSVDLITCRAVKLSDTAAVANHLMRKGATMLFFGDAHEAPPGLQLLRVAQLNELGTSIATIVK